MDRKKKPLLARLGECFLDEFPRALGVPFVTLRKHLAVAWRDGDQLNECSLVAYSLPDRRHADPAPACVRLAVNQLRCFIGYTDFGTIAARRLGVPDVESFRPPPALDTFEWTVLGDELAEFARWWPELLRARGMRGQCVPPPPHPCLLSGQSTLRSTRYAWSVAADDAYSTWAARQRSRAA